MAFEAFFVYGSCTPNWANKGLARFSFLSVQIFRDKKMWSVTVCSLDRFFVSFDKTKAERPEGFVAFESISKFSFEEKTEFDDE